MQFYLNSYLKICRKTTRKKSISVEFINHPVKLQKIKVYSYNMASKFLVPKHYTVLTPGVLNAIRSLPRFMFYLPPGIIKFHVPTPENNDFDNDDDILEIRQETEFHWKLIPWAIFLFLAAGVGTGCCGFILLGKLHLFQLQEEVDLFRSVLLLLLFFAGLIHIAVYWMALYAAPEMRLSVNRSLKLEREC